MELNKKKIAVIGLKGLPAFGGAATVGENIIRELYPSFKFTVLSVKSHSSPDFKLGDVEQVIFRNFPIQKINIFFYYIKCCLYVLFIRKFDLIHLHHTDGAFILPLLRLRYKVILTSHARPQFLSKWPWFVKFFFSINEFIAIKLASIFTAVSRPLQQAYVKKYKRKVIYIPNGVNLKLATKFNDKYINTEPYILFAAGRIIPSKGLHLVLEALNQLNYKGKIKVVGNLDHLPNYKSKIMNLKGGLNIEFLDLIKDKTTLLSIVKGADIFLFPSLTEAMSIMLFEAALMKTPIVCSDIPANTAVFNNDEVTFFHSNKVEDLMQKIKLAMSNQSKPMLESKVSNAYLKLEKNYSWRKIAIKYKELYEGNFTNS